MSALMRFLADRGLRSRIIWTTALVSGLAMGAMIGTVVLSLNGATRSNVDATLSERFQSTRSAVESERNSPGQALETSVDSIEDSTWLYDRDGNLVEGPKAGRRVRAVANSLGTVSKRTTITKRERVYLAAPVTIRGGSSPGPGVLVVSESLEPYESNRTEILTLLITLGLAVTAGATAIAAWTMSRTLAPVEAMAGLAEDWSERELDSRFDDRGAENEIAHLGRTLNVLLDRVAGALRGEQRLTSELAHELRTPLSGIRGEAELALITSAEPETRERLDRVVTLVDQMSTTITTLLAIARGEEDQTSTRTSVDDIISATLANARSGKNAIGIHRADPSAGGVHANATTGSAARALSPLIENALQHAAGRVTLSVSESSRTVDITVSDDGPGLPQDGSDPETLFAPGARAANSTGAGLGLALARRVARSLGGDVTVTSVREPTSFTLSLPRP
jgi:two-component system OmpR family sensor kinase